MPSHIDWFAWLLVVPLDWLAQLAAVGAVVHGVALAALLVMAVVALLVTLVVGWCGTTLVLVCVVFLLRPLRRKAGR